MKIMKKWISENINNYNIAVRTEEDLKIKVLIPYLKMLGYNDEDMRFEHKIEVHIGTKKTVVYSDIEIIINGRVELVIDAKKPGRLLNEKDVLQVESYAKLVDTPHALYAAVVNGEECITIDTYSGVRSKEIPSKQELLRCIDKVSKTNLKEIEIREVESVLFTLNNTREFYKVISECKGIIEKRGLIRSDQSFKEMTKIILTKMNEERRVKANEGKNRFTSDYLKIMSKGNDIPEIDVFKKLFNEAKEKYPSIYTNSDESIAINDSLCILELVSKLEVFSFLGTGDDIKGAVYEIFLKATLRGEFDQYFTPRELVDFMVRCADPNMGDVILDPACGSGGFLIQAFRYVNAKIDAAGLPEVDNVKKFNALIDKCLWGQEADYDLHVLAKINLIMHGDGWNNIYQGDTLKSEYLPENSFDLILENPPFTIPYTFPDVLGNYDLGRGKEKEELDLLFVEKSIRLLKPGKDMYIILPEGILNIRKYQYFREWLLEKTDILLSISLPEGAFIPFGGSVSKTCILAVRKRGKKDEGYTSPRYVFLGRAKEVGYEVGKKTYIEKNKNDLPIFEKEQKSIFRGIHKTKYGGECGWITQENISEKRLDASYLLNQIEREALRKKFDTLVPLDEVCKIENEVFSPMKDKEYYYLEVPDISADTGVITNIRKLSGDLIGDSFHKFYAGDILFTRINPRKRRVAIAPPIKNFGLVSKEVYRLVYKQNDYISEQNWYILCAILQSDLVTNQIVRLSTGSSSSRARVQIDDLLNDVYIPIPDEQVQERISATTKKSMDKIWKLSQVFLKNYTQNQELLGNKIDKNLIRGI